MASTSSTSISGVNEILEDADALLAANSTEDQAGDGLSDTDQLILDDDEANFLLKDDTENDAENDNLSEADLLELKLSEEDRFNEESEADNLSDTDQLLQDDQEEEEAAAASSSSGTCHSLPVQSIFLSTSDLR